MRLALIVLLALVSTAAFADTKPAEDRKELKYQKHVAKRSGRIEKYEATRAFKAKRLQKRADFNLSENKKFDAKKDALRETVK